MEHFQYSNPHPQGKQVRDCVKRAFVHVTGKSYHDIQLELNRLKKVTGAEKFNSNQNWRYYVEKVLQGKKLSFPAVKGQGRMTGLVFAIEHPTGKYVLRMAGHLSCCVDGKILDTWDCSDKCVYNAWKVEA